MEIRADEISRIIREQIKDYGKKVDVAETGTVLSQATRAKVLLDHEIDPAILGGVVAQVGSLVYDGSVRTQLEDLRQQLKR